LQNGGATGTFDKATRKVTGITIEKNNVTTCTFTNDPGPGTVTVIKKMINDNGGTATADQYTLKVGSTTVINGTQTSIPVGKYVVSESGPTAGYAASFSGDCDAQGNLTVQSGQAYTCTITNNDIAPKLTLSKSVTNDNGGGASVTDFTLTATGPTTIF